MAKDGSRGNRNHLLWIGPVVVLSGFVSYYVVFARFPVLRDFPWVNLPLIWAGVALAGVGIRRALRSGRGRILGSLALVFSLGVAALFHVYVFYWSYQLPEPAKVTTGMTAAPDFTLNDQYGRPVTLSELRGRNVVLVFYRGHW